MQRTPQAPAVVDGDLTLTYEELDRRADRLATHLRSMGIQPDAVAGVYMESCAEFVVGCLAAMKAGGAFLPLELAYPDSLLEEVVADSEPRVVLTKERYGGRLPREQARFCLDDGWERTLPGDSGGEGGPEPDPGNLVFVAYSSGTTGKPKGVANPHRAAVRSYLWRFGVSDYGPGDRVGCNVFLIWEIFRPLLRGAAACIIPDDVIYDPDALVRYLEEHRITETLMTPSLLETVLGTHGPGLGERLANLRVLWLNGEVVTRTLAQRAMQTLPETRVLNVYSIAETHEVAAGDVRELLDGAPATYCPVGRPMNPDRTYLLDEDLQPVREGDAGELYVGGGCLARGYVNRPKITKQRFLADPFDPSEEARMYRTGDRARLLPDGTLEILGRVDFTVKIRGYSIDLETVEAAIEKHLAVRNCVVVPDGAEGEDKRLVAYLVPAPEEERVGRYAGWRLDAGTGRSPEVRRCLQGSLPHYMIPAAFVEMETLPLQEATGKVDRERLPPPPDRPPRSAFDPSDPANHLSAYAPREDKETLLARIFEHVLRLEDGDVERGDDFFELGGHSLAAAELLTCVEECLDARPSMRSLLARPTVEGLCDAVETFRRGEDSSPESAGNGLSQRAADLRSEAVLEPEIAPDGNLGPTVASVRNARSIFLTGATGYLGAFLLDALLTQTEAVIHCLVRPRGDSDPASPIRDNLKRYGLWDRDRARRIVPVPGDLTKPLLGMSEDDFDTLAHEVDVVIHGGAMVNLAYPYEALKSANVEGTREVLRLACRYRTKPVHHVSTNGIFPPGGGRCDEETDLDALAGAREDGYGQSKWVAEKLVRQAAERGVPTSVYRPGNISGHSASGASNPRDFLGALLVQSLRSGHAPEVEGWRMEMTPVDFVSGTICHLAAKPGAPGRAYHLANPDPPPADEVFSWLEDMGYPLGRAPYPQWLEISRKTEPPAADDVVGGVLRGVESGTHELWEGNTYDDSNTRRVLREGGPQRPEIGAPLLGNYARYFADQGWVETPPKLSAGRSPA